MGMRSKGEARSARRNVLETAVCTGIECTYDAELEIVNSWPPRPAVLAYCKGPLVSGLGILQDADWSSILAGKELMFRDDCL